MKFLLELVVPCFGSQQQLQQTAAAAEDSFSNETQSLMKQPSSRKRRKRVRVAGKGQVGEWRPSLTVISEHRPAITEKSGDDEEIRKVRRKSDAGSSGDTFSRPRGSHLRFQGDDFGNDSFEPVIPAFSPTPFMF